MDNNTYVSYLDNYLSKLSKLDDTVRLQYGSDYTFLFQYIYPRVFELRSAYSTSIPDIIGQIGGISGTGTSASTDIPTASFTIDGLQNATLTVGQSHQKVWTSTNGASWNTTYTFSQDPENTTPCVQKDSNGNWLSGTWAGTDGLAGNTAQGSVTNAPIDNKVGCIATFVYTVTNAA